MSDFDAPAPSAPVAAPAPATDSGVSPAPSSSEPAATPAQQPAQTTEAAAPARKYNYNDSDDSATPQATDPAIVPDATPGTTTPERGVNPDKGIDPDAGDQPAETPAQPQESADPSQMTEQQRASYFHQLRQTAKQSTEQQLDERYQPEPIDDLKQQFMDEGYTEFEAEMKADREHDRQRTELAEIKADVADLNMGLATEAMEVVSTIPWLNPTNKDAFGDGKLANIASQLYENFVTRDERTAQIDPRTNKPIPGTGTIIEARLTPLQFYGALDQIRSSGASSAGMQAQRNVERQMAAVAPPTSVTTSRNVPFESMNAAQKKAYLEQKGHTFN